METNNCTVYACVNQKGGVGKTTTAVNLSVELANRGYSVLLIDADPQGSATALFGIDRYEVEYSFADVLNRIWKEEPFKASYGILEAEGVDILPSNMSTKEFEENVLSQNRQNPKSNTLLKTYIGEQRKKYDYIVIDNGPTVSPVTINVFTAADQVIIPCQPELGPVEGLQDLITSVAKAKQQLNPKLGIAGVLFVKVKSNTKSHFKMMADVKDAYGKNIKIFDTYIHDSADIANSSYENKSIFAYKKRGRVADEYRNLTTEIYASGANLDIKDKIVFRLVNTLMNRGMLENVPHREWKDLSIVYDVVWDSDSKCSNIVTVNNDFAKRFGMSEMNLFRCAADNTKKIFEPTVKPIEQVPVIKKMNLLHCEDAYVISSKKGSNGAASMLYYTEVLHKLATEIESDLYLVPVSTDSVLAIKANCFDPFEVAQSLAANNYMNVVPLNKRLSNQIYHYDKDLMKVSKATNTPNVWIDNLEHNYEDDLEV